MGMCILVRCVREGVRERGVRGERVALCQSHPKTLSFGGWMPNPSSSSLKAARFCFCSLRTCEVSPVDLCAIGHHCTRTGSYAVSVARYTGPVQLDGRLRPWRYFELQTDKFSPRRGSHWSSLRRGKNATIFEAQSTE